MRLLPKNTVKVQERAYTEALEHERSTLANAVSVTTQQLNNLKAEYETNSVRLRADYAEEYRLLRIRRDDLSASVQALEARQVEALKPLHERVKEIERLEEEVRTKMEQVAITRADLAHERQDLVVRTAAVIDRAQQVKQEEMDWHRRTQRLAEAEELNRLGTEGLSLAWEHFRKGSVNKEAELSVLQTMLTAEQVGISKEKEWIVMAKATLADERTKLESDKATLEVAFKELKRLQQS